jgi:hypothetical protein
MREQRGTDAGGSPAGRRTWSLVTCIEDGHSHAVADPVLAEGGAGAGRFPARCGRLIAPVALSAPEGPPCPLCG